MGAGNSGGVPGASEREQFEAIALAGGEPARALVLALLDRLAAAERDIAQLTERIDRLQAQGGESSRNSSRAPSSDLPKTRAQRRADARVKVKERAKQQGGEPRKSGKQPGATVVIRSVSCR